MENKKNERGWLTEINAYKGSTNIFNEKLAYQNQNLSNTTNTAMHNGNITAVEIKQNNGSGTDVHYQYNYSYDAINQLTAANYLAHTNAGTNGDYTTNNLTYDLNGNIKTLSRNRVGMMDNLIYNYKNSNQSNKIDRIDDSITDAQNGTYGFKDLIEQANEYEYDDNGNMVIDRNKGIDLIEYNHLNLPTRLKFSSGIEVHYEYDAAGSKVSRKEIASGGTQTKEYIYSGTFVYESHSAGNPLTLSFMSTGNGRLKVESSTVHEEYFIKDHLGNTRLTLKSTPAAQSFTYQQQNHYYAFGLTIEDLSSSISPESSNRITYNGKEFDKDLNWYHYGARFYDPQLGRWWSVDPMSEFYSPYNYVGNDPIHFIDPDGMCSDGTCPFCEEQGNLQNPKSTFSDLANSAFNSLFDMYEDAMIFAGLKTIETSIDAVESTVNFTIGTARFLYDNPGIAGSLILAYPTGGTSIWVQGLGYSLMGWQTYNNLDRTFASYANENYFDFGLNVFSTAADFTSFGSVGKLFKGPSYTLGGVDLQWNGTSRYVFEEAGSLRYYNTGKKVGSNWQNGMMNLVNERNSIWTGGALTWSFFNANY